MSILDLGVKANLKGEVGKDECTGVDVEVVG